MESNKKNNGASFNRCTGLLIIEVRHSNPNGDPDAESDPRTMDADGFGLISPVSYKRKLRDLVAYKEGAPWQFAKEKLHFDETRFDILEQRGRPRDTISQMNAETFKRTFWDARVFGNTFLEEMKGKEIKPGEKDHFISTGVVQFGPGISIAPVEIERLTTTNKSGVQEGKDRGMAPLGWRVVRHALYAMPFFINPMMAGKSGCEKIDLDLMKFLIPHAYRNTASASRPFVEIRHAWYAEHASPLGSCPDSLILDALTPRKIAGRADEASRSIDEYEIPGGLSDELRSRLAAFEDLCTKQWG
jgi:Cas7 group CRISPR-associated protein Csh2